MSVFRDLRLAASLTISDTGQLLEIDFAKVVAYESGLLVPRPREIQVLKGLAGIRRRNLDTSTCESNVELKASTIGFVTKPRLTRTRLKQPLIDDSDRLTDSPIRFSDPGCCQFTISLWLNDQARTSGPYRADRA